MFGIVEIPQRLWVALIPVLVAAMAMAGCSSSGPASPVVVQVEPVLSRSVQPVDVRVSGLGSGVSVTVVLSSTDAKGVRWASSARFRSARDGTLDLDRASADGGAYRGVNGMGLMESMTPQDAPQATSYQWSDQPRPFTVVVSSTKNATLAQTTFRRQIGPGVEASSQVVAQHGFDGVYFHGPVAGDHVLRPAILAFGGSEGGNSQTLLGAVLAAAGYPTLTIAYFHAPGLPSNLVKIPLEYFATALTWLRQQRGVDPNRVYVLGASRGTEAAQLVAVHYPSLVHGVVLGTPSNVVQQGLIGGAGLGGEPAGASAWSYRGKPIPYTEAPNDPDPTLVPQSVIPVENIKGPMFLVCGGADQVWTSCPFSQAIIARLNAHHDQYQHVLAQYSDAGHGVNVFIPYQPNTVNHEGSLAGQSAQSDQVALANVWPHLMKFLQDTSG